MSINDINTKNRNKRKRKEEGEERGERRGGEAGGGEVEEEEDRCGRVMRSAILIGS